MSRDEEVGATAVRAKKAGGAKAVTEPLEIRTSAEADKTRRTILRKVSTVL